MEEKQKISHHLDLINIFQKRINKKKKKISYCTVVSFSSLYCLTEYMCLYQKMRTQSDRIVRPEEDPEENGKPWPKITVR